MCNAARNSFCDGTTTAATSLLMRRYEELIGSIHRVLELIRLRFVNMWLTGQTGLFGHIFGRAGRSGFGCASTGEDVTAGMDATGLTAIVTGGASGIGAETARVLALRGAHVIIAARNLKAAETVKDDICRQTKGAKIDLLELDLSSLTSVKAFVEKFLATGYPLNILINNAGALTVSHQLSADGIESHFAINHIGHFYLTQLLVEKMKTSAKLSGIEGRIVILSSSAHNMSYKEGFKFDDINAKIGYNPSLAYGQSKLANVLHATELARRFQEEGANLTANSVHPGYINTNLFRNRATIIRFVRAISFYLWKGIPEGAATTLYVALHPDLKGVSGKYFADCNEERPSKLGVDQNLAKKLWDFSDKIILEKTAAMA